MKIRMRTWIGVALIVSTLITEAHSFFAKVYPKEAWIDTRTWFKKPPNFTVTLQWFIKYMADNVQLCTLYLIIFALGFRYDKRVCWMAAVNFLYFAFDYYMFLYDYKLSYNAYYALLIVNISTCIFILIPENKKAPGEAKVIEL